MSASANQADLVNLHLVRSEEAEPVSLLMPRITQLEERGKWNH